MESSNVEWKCKTRPNRKCECQNEVGCRWNRIFLQWATPTTLHSMQNARITHWSDYIDAADQKLQSVWIMEREREDGEGWWKYKFQFSAHVLGWVSVVSTRCFLEHKSNNWVYWYFIFLCDVFCIYRMWFIGLCKLSIFIFIWFNV